MDENKIIINRLLSDDLTVELEARLDEVLSADSPDYDEAERLTNQILALRGETPQKVGTAQIIDKICSGTEKSEYADEVTELEVVSENRSRRGIRTLLYGAAAAALIVGSVATIRHLGGRVPVRYETPPEITSQITTTVYNTDKAAVTTSAFDGNTENENIEVIVQTTAPAEQNPVKTEAKRETDPAENNIPQQTETVKTSPVQEQTRAQTEVTETAPADVDERQQIVGMWEVSKIVDLSDGSVNNYAESAEVRTKLRFNADGTADLWTDGAMSYTGQLTWDLSNGSGTVTRNIKPAETASMRYENGIITLTDPNIEISFSRYDYAVGDVNKDGAVDTNDTAKLYGELVKAAEKKRKGYAPAFPIEVRQDFWLYDLNGDEVLDEADLDALIGVVHAVGDKSGQRGDVNHDGIVDNLDARLILDTGAEAAMNRDSGKEQIYNDEVLAEFYLYDYDLSGVIDSVDSALVLHAAMENTKNSL